MAVQRKHHKAVRPPPGQNSRAGNHRRLEEGWGELSLQSLERESGSETERERGGGGGGGGRFCVLEMRCFYNVCFSLDGGGGSGGGCVWCVVCVSLSKCVFKCVCAHMCKLVGERESVCVCVLLSGRLPVCTTRRCQHTTAIREIEHN